MTGADLINLVENNGQTAEWHVTKYERVVYWTVRADGEWPLWQYERRGTSKEYTVNGYGAYCGWNRTDVDCEVQVLQQGKVVCAFSTSLATHATKPETDPYPGFDMLRGRVLSLTVDGDRPDILAAFEASA